MTTKKKTNTEFLSENKLLRLRLEEAEEILRAIGNGEVDAFVVSSPTGEQQVFTLKGAEQPYRILVESINEGAATLAMDGVILYCNKHMSTMLQLPLERLIGTKLSEYVVPKFSPVFSALLENCSRESLSEEIALTTMAGCSIPVLLSCCANDTSGAQGISVVVTDLTQQQRNEEIVASEHFSTSIVEQASDAIIVCDVKGKIIRASRLAHDLCGANPLLKPFKKMFPLRIEDSGVLFSLLPYLQAGCFSSIEVEFKRNDGKTFHLLLKVTPLKNIWKQTNGSIVTLADITERKLTEQALQQSEVSLQASYSHLQVVNEELQVAYKELQAQSDEIQEQNHELMRLWEATRKSEDRHRVLAETMLQGVVHQDSHGTIITMNPSAERILGKDPGDFLGSSSVDEEQDTIHENGELFSGMEHPSMVALQTGLPVHGVIMGVFNPKRDEYRWIKIDAVPVFHPGETVPSEVFTIFEDITERRQAEQQLQKAHDELERRVRERTKDLANSIERLHGEMEDRERAESSLFNETVERLQAVEALREKEQLLIHQSRQAAMGEMIGNIAHQWRQPLNTLGLIVQHLSLKYELGEFTKEFLGKSVEQSMQLVQHMSKTIDDFRNYFRPDREKVDFRVSEAISHTVKLIEDSFKSKLIKIEVINEDSAVIHGYRNEFSQALLNILNNARDALTERKTENPRVTITSRSEQGRAVTTISDNAGGIPQDILNKIFEPYFTTKGPQAGTGIGLFMSKTIVEKNMGGSLSVCNTADGAEFRIEV